MQVGDLITFHETGQLATIIKTSVSGMSRHRYRDGRQNYEKDLATIYLLGEAKQWNPTTVTMKYLTKTAEVVNENR